MHFRLKRVHVDTFRPYVHTNTLSVFIENSSMWKRSWKWIKTKTHTHRIVWKVKNGRVKKRRRHVQARVWSMRIVFYHVTTCNSIVFERFSVDSRKRIKTVLWTRIHRCIFYNNENAYFSKRISADRDLVNIRTVWQSSCLTGTIAIHEESNG